MSKYTVLYSTTNANQFETMGWNTFTEHETRKEAIASYKNSKEIKEYMGLPVYAWCMVGKSLDTPLMLIDYRDKSKWLICGCADVVNRLNSDYTMNKPI